MLGGDGLQNRIKVGAAQFASAVGDVDANMARHLDLIAQGRAAGLDVLVLPELSLTGHHGPERLLDAAMDRRDARLGRLAAAAGPMAVTVGFIEETAGAQIHNSAAILRDGRMIHLHRKMNLPTYGQLEEGKHYAAGRHIETCALGGPWTAGLMICADVWNPALTHLAMLHGTTLMLTPVSSGVEAVGDDFDNPAGWALACRFYAMIYGTPMIMANRTGTERGLTFWGGSRIVDPFGQELAVAGSGDEMIVAELDYDRIRQARTLLPTQRDADLPLVLNETLRLARKQAQPDAPNDLEKGWLA